MTKPVYASLVGSDLCSCDGHIVRHPAPVLAMCRLLVDLGFDPERDLLAFRGHQLAMRIKIGTGSEFHVPAEARRRWSDLKAARKRAREAQDRVSPSSGILQPPD